jgi:hypothetical protein
MAIPTIYADYWEMCFETHRHNSIGEVIIFIQAEWIKERGECGKNGGHSIIKMATLVINMQPK